MAETISPTTEESIQQAEYEVPLSPAELLDLGRAKSILSQIDFMLTEALSGASKTPAWAAYIFADRATMSGRIGMLDSILAGVSNSGAKNAGKKLVKALYRVNEYRNILFHGMWAHQLNPKTKQGNRGDAPIDFAIGKNLGRRPGERAFKGHHGQRRKKGRKGRRFGLYLHTRNDFIYNKDPTQKKGEISHVIDAGF